MFLKGQGRRWPLIVAVSLFACTLVYFHKQLTALPLPGMQNPLRSSSMVTGFPSNVESPRNLDGTKTHTEVYSVSTRDRRYFKVQFDGFSAAANVNIIPHPHWNDTFIIVAQKPPSQIPNTVWFAELVCNAKFKNGRMECIEPPAILPIAATAGDRCNNGKIDYLNNLVGPHDARVFYGPKNPYVIYGSNGVKTACLAQWMEDFRLLVDWGTHSYEQDKFRVGTELHRPEGKYMDMEKNFFAFWDKDGVMYTHYEIHPKRVFAKVEHDGTVGPDLAPLAGDLDKNCMAARMKKLTGSKQESFHQSTNSLSITMCNRADPNCKAEESNTHVFVLFQYKSYFEYHGQYEPYVMIFNQQPPFQVLGISNKPIWIHGRGGPGTGKLHDGMGKEALAKWKQTEMLYVTSMSWKERGRKYHGFLDDILFIGFGIEDEVPGGIDIVAGDLFADMGSCFGT